LLFSHTFLILQVVFWIATAHIILHGMATIWLDQMAKCGTT